MVGLAAYTVKPLEAADRIGSMTGLWKIVNFKRTVFVQQGSVVNEYNNNTAVPLCELWQVDEESGTAKQIAGSSDCSSAWYPETVGPFQFLRRGECIWNVLSDAGNLTGVGHVYIDQRGMLHLDGKMTTRGAGGLLKIEEFVGYRIQ